MLWEYIVLRIISLNTLCDHCSSTVVWVILILFNFLILRFLQTNETWGGGDQQRHMHGGLDK
jgi:hypothetical protein